MGSIGAYVHMMQTPFYFASKAGLVSTVKSLPGLLRKVFGVRNAAICQGPVKVSVSLCQFVVWWWNLRFD